MSENSKATELATRGFLALVFPDLAVRWRQVAASFFDAHRMRLKVTEGIRTFDKQWDYFRQGRRLLGNGEWEIIPERDRTEATPKVVTFAMPGLSLHNYGLALDTAFSGPDPYLQKMRPDKSQFYFSEYGRFSKAFGLEWGGDWTGKKKDRPHVQMRYGLSIHDIQMIYEYGGIKAVWYKCNQIVNGGRV